MQSSLTTPLDILGARQRELETWELVQNPDQVFALLALKKWKELIPFADAVASDVPVQLAATDPAFYRTMRKALTEVHIRGIALNANELRRLSRQNEVLENSPD
jgi:hypothetical protein